MLCRALFLVSLSSLVLSVAGCGSDTPRRLPPLPDAGAGLDAAIPDEDAGGEDASTCSDGDMDGICDAMDACEGSDDTVDADGDGIPDDCDCDVVTCDANASCTEATTGATCACNMGYTGDGSVCTIVDCGALMAPANGMLVAPTTTFGATATATCDAGYTLAGDAMRTCQGDGSWSGAAATCAPVDCGALMAPTNGMVTAPTTTLGSTATYSCSSGFVLMGGRTRTCQADGAWSGSAPTCGMGCPALSNPANGVVTAPATTPGSRATYRCNAGFTLLGSADRVCVGTSWLGEEPTCAAASCACSGSLLVGERVSADSAGIDGSSLTNGHRGTVTNGLMSSVTPLGVQWDGWSGGHNGRCGSVTSCDPCTLSARNNRWYVSCANVTSLRLTCVCGGRFHTGDRVVALVANPSAAPGLARGTLGTVIAATNLGGLGPLVAWDGWAGGHDGSCGSATCGTCAPSGVNRWYVACGDIGLAP